METNNAIALLHCSTPAIPVTGRNSINLDWSAVKVSLDVTDTNTLYIRTLVTQVLLFATTVCGPIQFEDVRNWIQSTVWYLAN